MRKHDSPKQLIQNMIPISEFNKGKAGQIFEDLEKNSPKIIMKNNKPVAILLSLENYLELMDRLEDTELGLKALDRLAQEGSKIYSHEEILKELGITKSDLDSIPDGDIS